MNYLIIQNGILSIAINILPNTVASSVYLAGILPLPLTKLDLTKIPRCEPQRFFTGLTDHQRIHPAGGSQLFFRQRLGGNRTWAYNLDLKPKTGDTVIPPRLSTFRF